MPTFKQGTLPIGGETVKDQIAAEKYGTAEGCDAVTWGEIIYKLAKYVCAVGWLPFLPSFDPNKKAAMPIDMSTAVAYSYRLYLACETSLPISITGITLALFTRT